MPVQPNQPVHFSFNIIDVIARLLKYVLEGLVVAIAAYTLPAYPMAMPDIVQIAAISMATFSILDFFAPSMSQAARFGAGAGLGANLVGFPGNRPTRVLAST
jgi:hypothetical protein